MKTLGKTHIALFLITLTLFNFSCNSIENTDILGKWNVNNSVLSEVSLTTDQENNLREELESMVFYFKDDGLLLYSNYYRTGAHGQWKLNPENETLSCTYQYERATFSDTYRVELKNEYLKLYSMDFEGVKEITLTLDRSGS